MSEETPTYTPSPDTGAKLYHKVNPCDIDRFWPLAPIGDAAHLIWSGFAYGTDCTCCLGFRLIFLLLAAFGAGMALA